MLKAIVQNQKGESAVIDLATDWNTLYQVLHAVGQYLPPERLRLRDEEDEEYSVKLYADNDIGNYMLPLFGERDTLYDAYLLDLAVTNAREEIKPELEQNILRGQYQYFSEVLDDINEMKIAASNDRITFYCPLKAFLDEGEGEDYSPVSNWYIADNRSSIEDKLYEEQTPDLGDMAEYLGDRSGVGSKLLYAVWGLVEKNGEIYGKIDCYLNETLSDEEIEKLRRAVSGQNSDGFGEGFEQCPIKTADGDLYVSFWYPSNEYFLYTESEMDAYFQNRNRQQMGGM